MQRQGSEGKAVHLEEPSCLQLENKLVMHLVSWLVLA